MDPHAKLSRRERQIMDIIWSKGQATAVQIQAAMADAPSNASVRTFLRILEQKGRLRHRQERQEFVYTATHERSAAGRSALQRVLATFFEGSVEKALSVYLSDGRRARAVDPKELQRLTELVQKARQEKTS